MTDRVKLFYSQLGRNIKQERLKLKLTQEGLAFSAGLHRTHIAMIENATRKPHIHTVKQLADALNVSIDYLCRIID